MARMSISLRKEQGFYFMQRISSNIPISAQKMFECSFQGKRDSKKVHLT